MVIIQGLCWKQCKSGHNFLIYWPNLLKLHTLVEELFLCVHRSPSLESSLKSSSLVAVGGLPRHGLFSLVCLELLGSSSSICTSWCLWRHLRKRSVAFCEKTKILNHLHGGRVSLPTWGISTKIVNVIHNCVSLSAQPSDLWGGFFFFFCTEKCTFSPQTHDFSLTGVYDLLINSISEASAFFARRIW